MIVATGTPTGVAIDQAQRVLCLCERPPQRDCEAPAIGQCRVLALTGDPPWPLPPEHALGQRAVRPMHAAAVVVAVGLDGAGTARLDE